jgi:hypothetical protein
MRCALVSPLFVCLISATALAAEEDKSIPLFNGKCVGCWEHFLVDEDVKKADVWSVRDGLLVCKGEPMGYLCTKKEFTNFKLVVEWRWAPGEEPGNSGVLMRITGDPRALPKCVEAQLKHESAGDVYGFHGFQVAGPKDRMVEIPGHKLGGDLLGVKKAAGNENPAGEWNKYEITLNGGDLTLIVNGKEVNKATGCDVVAGKIGLQSEGGEIHFRTVSLTPIEKDE